MSRVAAHAHFAFATIAIVLGGAGAAQASFVTTSPDPFPPGSGYVQANGCVTSGPLAGLCSSNVMGTILSANSTFSGGNEFVGLNELVVGDLSDGSAPVGHFSVTGTLNLTLLGRTDPLETGQLPCNGHRRGLHGFNRRHSVGDNARFIADVQRRYNDHAGV
jgi:hypothetical protein